MFPYVDVSNTDDIQRTIKFLDEVKQSAKRKLQNAKDSQAKKQKIQFISHNPQIPSHGKVHYKRNSTTSWPIGNEDFKLMDKTIQNTILMTMITEILESNNKQGYTARWLNTKRDLEKYYNVGRERLDRIANNVWKSISTSKQDPKSCVVPIDCHGNTGNIPKHALSTSFSQYIKNFIDQIDTEPMPFNYIPGKKDVVTLPPSTDRNALYGEFIEYLHSQNIEETCAYSTFFKKLKEVCPEFLILDTMEDVCDTCCKSRIALRGTSRNSYTRMQQQMFTELNQHIDEMKRRRVVYFFDRHLALHGAQSNDEDKERLWEMISKKYTQYSLLEGKWMAHAISNQLKVFTFDFKQTLPLPYDPIQPANYFYHSKRNCNIFGIVNESSNDPYNIFIYDECCGSKTADEIITLLNNVLLKSQIGMNDHLVLYADNCSGQNKNRYMVAMLTILMMKKVCSSVRLKFLVVGHTQQL